MNYIESAKLIIFESKNMYMSNKKNWSTHLFIVELKMVMYPFKLNSE